MHNLKSLFYYSINSYEGYWWAKSQIVRHDKPFDQNKSQIMVTTFDARFAEHKFVVFGFQMDIIRLSLLTFSSW